jgi:hypothetical protein
MHVMHVTFEIAVLLLSTGDPDVDEIPVERRANWAGVEKVNRADNASSALDKRSCVCAKFGEATRNESQEIEEVGRVF